MGTMKMDYGFVRWSALQIDKNLSKCLFNGLKISNDIDILLYDSG